MSDWADDIARVLAGPRASDDDFLMSLSQVTFALRKAKADGMREAAEIVLLNHGESRLTAIDLIGEAASELDPLEK